MRYRADIIYSVHVAARRQRKRNVEMIIIRHCSYFVHMNVIRMLLICLRDIDFVKNIGIFKMIRNKNVFGGSNLLCIVLS